MRGIAAKSRHAKGNSTLSPCRTKLNRMLTPLGTETAHSPSSTARAALFMFSRWQRNLMPLFIPRWVEIQTFSEYVASFRCHRRWKSASREIVRGRRRENTRYDIFAAKINSPQRNPPFGFSRSSTGGVSGDVPKTLKTTTLGGTGLVTHGVVDDRETRRQHPRLNDAMIEISFAIFESDGRKKTVSRWLRKLLYWPRIIHNFGCTCSVAAVQAT